MPSGEEIIAEKLEIDDEFKDQKDLEERYDRIHITLQDSQTNPEWKITIRSLWGLSKRKQDFMHQQQNKIITIPIKKQSNLH